MPPSPDRPSPRLRGYGPLASIVVAWASLPLLDPLASRAFRGLEDAVVRVLSGFPGLAQSVLDAVYTLEAGVAAAFAVSLFVATLALPLGFFARRVARARVREGQGDPAAGAQAWTAAHPRVTAALLAVVPAATQALFVEVMSGRDLPPAAIAAVALAMGAAQWRLARAGLRAVIAPLDGVVAASPGAIEPGEIRFDAVAVTPEARGAVAALAALTVGMVAWLATRDSAALFRDENILLAVVAYTAVAAGAALAFRRASRIAVGRDGVYVAGTSRARLYPYAALDEVRERGTDLELVRAGQVRVRLQLHGEDALRRAAIVGRIREAIASSRDVASAGVASFVSSASTAVVARSARGGADYREASVTRDALWSLVEGSGVDAAARTAAARAVVDGGNPPERERLRVAAALCADPRVRVELEELAGDDADSHAPPVAMRAGDGSAR